MRSALSFVVFVLSLTLGIEPAFAQAGPKIAAILSVVESCHRLKFPVRDYLAAVLPGLADCPSNDFLTSQPQRWQRRGAEFNRMFATVICLRMTTSAEGGSDPVRDRKM